MARRAGTRIIGHFTRPTVLEEEERRGGGRAVHIRSTQFPPKVGGRVGAWLAKEARLQVFDLW